MFTLRSEMREAALQQWTQCDCCFVGLLGGCHAWLVASGIEPSCLRMSAYRAACSDCWCCLTGDHAEWEVPAHTSTFSVTVRQELKGHALLDSGYVLAMPQKPMLTCRCSGEASVAVHGRSPAPDLSDFACRLSLMQLSQHRLPGHAQLPSVATYHSWPRIDKFAAKLSSMDITRSERPHQGVMDAATPSGCRSTIWRLSGCTVCRMSPSIRRHSSANHSMLATLQHYTCLDWRCRTER